MNVKVTDSSGANVCACGSWLDHWMKLSEQALSPFCSERSCTEKPKVGARVHRVGDDRNWFIVPLCAAHGATSATLSVIDRVALVPAKVSPACGK
jgi:hypothetical protein